MVTYVNHFSCVANNGADECIITLSQCSPEMDDDGKFIRTAKESVISLVMTKEFAANLSEAIRTTLQDNNGVVASEP
ncbi:hypothetical protein D3Z52_11765 [Clostridiaceae bacterium]|nr:hypothetical protein [Clostridiaceae bacterium]NBI84549.1 hypothetical protein [Clostridiaceae bacterium]